MYDNRLAVSPNAETERILATAARFRLVPILRKYRLFLSPVRLSGQSLRSISQVNLSGKITQLIDIPRQNNSITDPSLNPLLKRYGSRRKRRLDRSAWRNLHRTQQLRIVLEHPNQRSRNTQRSGDHTLRA